MLIGINEYQFVKNQVTRGASNGNKGILFEWVVLVIYSVRKKRFFFLIVFFFSAKKKTFFSQVIFFS